MSAFEDLLEHIAGFFIIEAHVRRTTGEFRPEHVVDDLWEDVCERMVGLVAQALKTIDEPEIILGAKGKLLAFIQAIEVPSSALSESIVPNATYRAGNTRRRKLQSFWPVFSNNILSCSWPKQQAGSRRCARQPYCDNHRLKIAQIVTEDDSQAMVVNDNEEFDKVASVSWMPAEGEWSEQALRSCV